MDKRYADIVVDNKHLNTDALYTYLVPETLREKLDVGYRVFVPFGKSGKLLEGIIISFKESCNVPVSRIKSIQKIVDDPKVLNANQIKLGLWMKDYYLAKYIDTFRAMIPTGVKGKVDYNVKLIDETYMNEKTLPLKHQNIIDILKKKKTVKMSYIKSQLKYPNTNSILRYLKDNGIITVDRIDDKGTKKIYEKILSINEDHEGKLSANAVKQRMILEYLKVIKSASQKEVVNELNVNLSSIKSLEQKGFIKIESVQVNRDAIRKDYTKTNKLDLTYEQQNCLDTIKQNIYGIRKDSNTFLIHGVTGSGKTEVYMQLIDDILQQGKDSIVLVPEISLTPQTVERFVSRFGDNVAVIHSRLSPGEKYDEWTKIRDGKVKIVVGARSAVFVPFNNLGLIIIDEEHESTYYSSNDPKYSTIEVARKRCEIENCFLVLGSATPSIESYYNAKNGEYKLLEMKERANKSVLPKVDIIDMKEELARGNKSFFSYKLYNEIKANLQNKKQTILFMNRRGFSTFVSCRSCGYVIRCDTCDISMTYHSNKNMLMCHYCGKAVHAPRVCPECGSKYIKYFGAGTEKVQEAVEKYFPEARVARMDVDTTSKKGSHERILDKVKNNEVDILIGTQMITKGLDFPNVTLVGILAADMSLNLPDFRASERTFQLLTQVSGRAGRGQDEGRVVLQTYEPEHYAIQLAKKHDYNNFYDNEILIRNSFEYPPFKNIISIVLRAKDEEVVQREVFRFKNDLLKRINTYNNTNNYQITGPIKALVYKIKGYHRWQIIIKADDEILDDIKQSIYEEYKKYIKNKRCTEVIFNININPYTIM